MNLPCHPQSRFDEIDVAPRGRDAFLRLLLERVKYIHRIGKPDCIDHPVRVVIEVLHDLQHTASPKTLERLGIDVSAATLRLEDREPHRLPDGLWELFEVVKR